LEIRSKCTLSCFQYFGLLDISNFFLKVTCINNFNCINKCLVMLNVGKILILRCFIKRIVSVQLLSLFCQLLLKSDSSQRNYLSTIFSSTEMLSSELTVSTPTSSSLYLDWFTPFSDASPVPA
jgi:hypothetical protein